VSEAHIEFTENGPVLVKGPMFYTNAAGQETKLDKAWIALCRCGGSGNKPFCDGTHKGKGFQAAKGELRAA